MNFEHNFPNAKIYFKGHSFKHIVATPYIYTRNEKGSFTVGLNFLCFYLGLEVYRKGYGCFRDLGIAKGQALDSIASNWGLTRRPFLRYFKESDNELIKRLKLTMRRTDLNTHLARIVELDDYRPHSVASMTCPKCSKDWTATYPSSCTSLECPGCGHFVRL